MERLYKKSGDRAQRTPSSCAGVLLMITAWILGITEGKKKDVPWNVFTKNLVINATRATRASRTIIVRRAYGRRP